MFGISVLFGCLVLFDSCGKCQEGKLARLAYGAGLRVVAEACVVDGIVSSACQGNLVFFETLRD
ncbi:MAG: hypothetical protein NPIRA02_06920 [Nitrospirales bacterium]|nr:MAG: hypothetical protein NPIRA02_06920 [Nitrospirales bacterium]